MYEAPKAQHRVTIGCAGVVPTGADTCETGVAVVQITPVGSSDGAALELRLDSSGTLRYEIRGKDQQAAEWYFRVWNDTLSRVLTEAGYTNLLDGEISESVRVIHGCMGGPKATPLQGQTSFLDVISVSTE